MNAENKTPLLAIVGPTATGKTELSVRIAQKLGSEIVSADSMLVYRSMNIGTAKPTMAERKGIPHHMIDVADPDEMYNVLIYSRAAGKTLKEIHQRHNLPILTGGTGLYIKAVIDGYNFSEAGSDPELREKLKNECESLGRETLHERLKKIDPETASRLHINDVKRVIRALEVYYLSGKTLSSSSEKAKHTPYKLLMYGLTMDREKLYTRIEERVDKMISAGLVGEVRDLLHSGYSDNLTSMQGLGYKEIILFLKGKISFDEAIELLKKNTRRFAKRQLTWFGRDSRIMWIDVGVRDIEEVTSEITQTAEGVLKSASNVF